MGNNTGDNISAVLGLDGLDQIDESGLPDAGSDEANEGLESSYDLTDPPDDDGGEEGDGVEPEGEQPQGRKQLVPLGALQEERTKRQEKERELEETRAMQQRMQERFNEMMMRLQGVQKEPPAPEEDVIPDFHEDPAGHVEGLKRQFAREMEVLRQAVGQQQGMTQQQQHVQQLAQRATAAETEFRAKAPDYDNAASFFQQRKMAEYQAFGLDAAQAQQQLARDCTGIVQGAVQRGANPAEVMYNLAKALGYSTQAPAKQPGQQRQPAPKAPTTLSNVSGSPKAPDEDNGGELTLAKVTNMSDKEFDAFFAGMSKGSIQRPRY